MSDTVVVMNKGDIQQVGSPVDIYNEPKNAFVADFIGESNILNGRMIKDLLVEISGHQFECVDKGFGENKSVDVVIRPEDIKLVNADDAHISGVVQSVTFKGVHYEMLIEAYENPDKYPMLTIRVSGYAVNFHRISKEQQRQVISRTFHTSF